MLQKSELNIEGKSVRVRWLSLEIGLLVVKVSSIPLSKISDSGKQCGKQDDPKNTVKLRVPISA